jgi:peptidoglycan/LPS O-acetylase OafA/YrhL
MIAMDRPRLALLDSLRAIAALGVVGFHAGTVSGTNGNPLYGGFTSHLNVGVTIFFLLSGFLLYRPHARAILQDADGPSVGRYAAHRFLRIAPAYWVALTLLGFWPGLEGVFTRQWWVYYGFLQSYRLEWLWGGISPAWSLSIEVAFYAFLPIYGAAARRLCRDGCTERRARQQAVLLAILGLAGLAFQYTTQAAHRLNLMSILPAYLLWFATGMGLAVAHTYAAGRDSHSRLLRMIVQHPGVCWALALALYVGIATSTVLPRLTPGAEATPLAHTVEHVLYCLVALLVMLPAVFGEQAGGFPRRVLANRILKGLGTISYGIFLWHSPLLRALLLKNVPPLIEISGLSLLSVLISILPATVVCGWLSYRLIERPAMRLARSKHSPRESAAAAPEAHA